MSWGTELWDQYDKIAGHTEHGIEFIKRVSTFVEKRIHVEQSYAKDLRRLVKSFMKKDEETSNYTAVKSFSKMINEVNDLAGQRELISEYMGAEVLTPLKELARDITGERRKHLASGAELHRQLKSAMDILERTKKQYEKASEEAETAHHKLEKADNDPNSTKAKIDQFTTTLRQKEQTAEECRNNYILKLEETNGFREQHYTQRMPALVTEIEGMNERLINKYKELLAQYAECHRRVFPVVNTCLDNVTGASEFIDAKKDNQQLVDDLKTGFPIPGDVEFEEYLGKQAKKIAKKGGGAKVEPKEDFSHLPPEQRRKKLQQKVDSLEALRKKAENDRTAMEKMKDIYTQQPSLGDANAIAQSLESNANKIAEYDAEIAKFKGYLQDAHTVLAAEPPPKSNKHTIGVFSKPSSKFSPKPGKKSDKKKDKHKDKDKAANNSDENESPVTSPTAADDSPKDLGGASWGKRKSEEWSDGEEDGPVVDELNLPARALYDFEAQNEDELCVQQNDQIVILEDLQDGWLRVRRGGEDGYVPESYVQRL